MLLTVFSFLMHLILAQLYLFPLSSSSSSSSAPPHPPPSGIAGTYKGSHSLELSARREILISINIREAQFLLVFDFAQRNDGCQQRFTTAFIVHYLDIWNARMVHGADKREQSGAIQRRKNDSDCRSLL